jgi:microcystin-dependent protein
LTNVSHASLSGSNLHEPKGIGTAASGSVYIADGAGSGSWTISESVTSGMIADFATPIAPTGWLECDGSDVSTTTYNSLYNAMSIQQTGSRGVGSAVITGLSSTTNMKVGYYVFGTGITSGTTIQSVDSSTQITLSANAGSSGTSTVIVSPWLLASGTIRLPDLKTAGRFRRSRTSSTIIGAAQADQNQAHTHTGTSDSSGSHTHTASVTDPGHTHQQHANTGYDNGISAVSGAGTRSILLNTAFRTDSNTTGVTVANSTDGAHTHTFTTASSGSAEARPLTLVVMTCVKT